MGMDCTGEEICSVGALGVGDDAANTEEEAESSAGAEKRGGGEGGAGGDWEGPSNVGDGETKGVGGRGEGAELCIGDAFPC